MMDFLDLPVTTRITNRSADVSGRILDIAYPRAGKLRSRKVVSRSQVKATSKYPSWKLKRMVHAESSGERNGFQLLDADSTILRYREQPVRIRFELNGQLHEHYPDVHVERSNGPPGELWEIKPRLKHLDPEVLARTVFMQTTLPTHGFLYRPIANEDLEKEPRLSNARKLLKHGNRTIDARSREAMRLLFKNRGTIYWASVTSGDLGPNACSALCRLVLEGSVCFDFQHALTPTTPFRWEPAGGWML